MRLRHLNRSLWVQFHSHRRALWLLQLTLSVLSFSLLTPLSLSLASALLTLSGQQMVGNQELLSFALSPWGLAWLLVSGSLSAMAIFLQHAGTLCVCRQPAEQAHRWPWRSSVLALRQLLTLAPTLLPLAALLVGAHLVSALVWGLPLLFLYQRLLGSYDLYYVVQLGPDSSLTFLLLALPWLALAAAWHLTLYLRGYLSLACAVLQPQTALRALRCSWRLSRGRSRKLLLAIALTAMVFLVLTLGNGLMFRWLMSISFALLDGQYQLLSWALPALALAYLCSSLLLLMTSVSVNGVLLSNLHRLASGNRPAPTPVGSQATSGSGVIWLSELLLVALAAAQLWLLWPEPPPVVDTQIVAHRGSSLLAPENSLAAIELAIDAGSHWLELDVRATQDQQLVLLHDRDLLRVAGDPRAIWQMTLAEVQQLDSGSWFDPAFADQRVPSLSDAVQQVAGRSQLYLEIKPDPASPDLTRLVVAELQQQSLEAQTIVASLYPQVLAEVRELAPNLRTSLLVHSMLGDFMAADVDVLAVREALVTPLLLSDARRAGKELHVWTINDPKRMAYFLDLGVDAIITDRPDALQQLLNERGQLTARQQSLLAWRFWLWD